METWVSRATKEMIIRPYRDLLNSAFVAMAIAAGITCLVVDVARIRPIALATDLLLGKYEYTRRYIKAYRQRGQ